ncbi:agamous-like MADS-box protein AGL104 [Gossypium hirsutum]|uniref:Agamous-like MADS-box protein AGL104 n=1 Tax=Gossypium hirsutum TaxID=3635 RepID=A0ABM2ZEM5_GOSHI|nr:agamous-like MADS-box protein AGL104 [Gossypium hirsutum]
MAKKMKRSGNSRSWRITYVKRRESVLKQPAELSMLYHIDVGLMMFSPTGQFTSFAHKGRVQDIFLRYLDHNDEHKECLFDLCYFCFIKKFSQTAKLRVLYESLKRLKYEAEVLDKLGRYHHRVKTNSDSLAGLLLPNDDSSDNFPVLLFFS